MPKEKVHVYFMPGMAASSSIFEFIHLPTDQIETHLLDWFLPENGISLEHYALEMCKKVHHKNPVLLGVSFGGLLVQEMAKHIATKKVIIVSSVKMNSELPKKMIFAKYTKIHKLLPTSLVNNVELLAKYVFGEAITKRVKLYEQYLSVKDKKYIDWCIDHMLNWSQTQCDPKVIHIQGDKDTVFPVKNITDCITVPNGTHTMIIHRYKWFNAHLPTLILN
jgi:esterase/lipase